MGPYLGDYAEDATLDFKWSSNSAAGASITRATNGTVSVYVGNSVTQLTTGVTDTEDFDSLTGIHHCRIDLSASATYAAGSECQVVLSAATIDGQTVNAVLAHFSIERSGGVLALLKGANGVAAIKSDTAAILTDTADMQPKLGTPAGASISADIAAIEAQTDDIGVAGAGLTALATAAEVAKIPKSDGTATWNATALAAIQSEANDALVAYDPPTRAELTSDVATLATAANLATVAGYLDTEIAAILADTNELQTDWANGGRLDLILDARASQASVDDLPTNAELATALAAADDAVLAAIPSAATVADAVWDEALAAHSGAGTAGLALSTASSGGVDPSVLADAIWDEALSGHATAGTAGKKLTDLTNADLSGVATAAALATVDGIVDDILVDTAVIGVAGAGLTALGDTRLANLDAAVSSRSTLTAGNVRTELATELGRIDAAVTTRLASGTVAADVTAVKAKTDLIPAAPAAVGDIPTAGAVADAVLDEVVEGAYTVRQYLRGLAAAMLGKVSGAATTTVAIRDTADSKDRVTATVDADGNRSAVTLDLT